MKWMDALGRTKHIRFDDSDPKGQEKAERKLTHALMSNQAITIGAMILAPVLTLLIVWFGWDTYSQLVHSLGNKVNHLGFLGKAIWSLLHGDITVWQKYLAIVNKKSMTMHLFLFPFGALLISSFVSIALYHITRIKELSAELFVRGARASHHVAESIRYLKAELRAKGERFQVAPRVTIPEDIFSKHMIAFGTTGVGKTQILWNILTGILSKQKNNFKLCLFDFKADFIQEYIHRPDFGLMAVHDERSHWWDFMEDIHSTLDIESLAYQLIPDGNEKDPFWRNTARNLVIDAIAYMKKAGLKGWGTLYEILGNRELILKALEKSGGSAAASISKENNTTSSIMTSLNEAIRPISILTKAWGNDGNGHEPISISKWVANDSSVPRHLIFGWDDKYAATLAPIFAAFMDGVLGTKLKPDSDKSVRIFMVWDEFASIPVKVNKLATALRTGRSIGISFFLGCLNINDIYARYGQEEGRTILGLLRTQFGLLVGGGDGAESSRYISESWGEQTVKVASWKKEPVQFIDDDGKQKSRNEWTIHWTETTRNAIGADTFIEGLQSVRQAGCVEGYAKFENLMPCKLRWGFYAPKGRNPEVIPSPALMNEFSNKELIENIMLVANEADSSKSVNQSNNASQSKGLPDEMKERIRTHHIEQPDPDFEEFPNNLDYPDDLEPDDLP